MVKSPFNKSCSERLQLHYLKLDTGGLVTAFSGGRLGPDLIKLDLSGCYLDDEGVKTVARRCPKLESLSLSGFSGVTDVGIMAILSQCR